MSKLIDILIPEDIRDDSDARFGSWLVQVGEQVEKNDPIAEVHTDKAAVEIAAPATGLLCEALIREDSAVESGMLIGRISPGDQPRESATIDVEKPDKITELQSNPASHTTTAFEASPAIRRLIKRHNLDVSSIQGSGRGGRITKSDVEELIGKPSNPARQLTPGYSPQPVVAAGTRAPHNHLRRQIAAHMQYSVQTAPHVTSVFECDLSAVQQHRSAHKDSFESEGHQLTYTSYFVAAAVEAIKEVPESNSSWHAEHLEIFSDCNIGVGTSLGDGGIVVPVLHQAQSLSLKEIAAGLTTLVSRARKSELSTAEMSNGTFTISNHGVSGSLVASPIIIHQPQSAILGIGKLQRRPVAVEENGEEVLKVKPMIYVTLTIDHRVLDAHQTNKFLTRFVDVLESWKQ